ncbi:MAG: glycine cleavage system protein H [Deltaproteobacteria bacterium]|nr:MAG: glycine cleavage system protein H [Deltaproteobacteria bacterium]
MRLGLDDIASALAMEADSITLPPVGSPLGEDQVLAEIAAAGKKARFLSPLAGTVTSVNRDVEESPTLIWRDPYRRGWLLMIKPDQPGEVFRLYSGESAKRWFEGEAKKVAGLFTRRRPNRPKKEAPGEDPLTRKIVREHWEKLAEVLLGSPPFEVRG